MKVNSHPKTTARTSRPLATGKETSPDFKEPGRASRDRNTNDTACVSRSKARTLSRSIAENPTAMRLRRGARIELDESANPKQMTMTVSSVSSSTGPRVPGRIPSEVNAIYKLDEKGLTRRNGRPERPTEFDDKDPAQIVFAVLTGARKDRKECVDQPGTGEVGAKVRPSQTPMAAWSDIDAAARRNMGRSFRSIRRGIRISRRQDLSARRRLELSRP